GLARTRDCMERPQCFTIAGAKGRDTSAHAVFRAAEPRDHHAVVVERCARDRVTGFPTRRLHAPTLFAGCLIERDELAVETTDEDQALADRDAAARPAAADGRNGRIEAGLVGPQQFSTCDFDRK